MPKGKKKGKFEHRRTELPYSSDEDAGIDMTNDNYSETSGQSDLRSNQDDAENEIQEKLEEKVLEIIDALSARANAARAAALVSLRNILQRRYFAHLLSTQRVTLADHITKALRRGKDGEKKAAAAVAPLLALQIGEEGTEEFMAEVRPALAAAAVDKSASLETRTECCSSLAVLCYLLEEDLTEILEIMKMYETIFSGSYLKNTRPVPSILSNYSSRRRSRGGAAVAGPRVDDGDVDDSDWLGLCALLLKGDGSVKVSGSAVEEGGWHAAALDAWALLLALAEPRHARALLRERQPSFARLADLLDACSLEVRLAAGGALATAHERCCDADEDAGDEAGDGAAAALPRLQRLARDSHKYRAKRDRKLQRATFRDILKYFEEGTVETERVRLGTESVELEGWGARAAYGALAAALGAGLGALAPHCAQLRAALALPDAAPLQPTRKLNKLQRHLQNSAACKARTVARNKSRDKRSAALAL